MKEMKKLTLFAFIMMILTSVFGVTNIGIGFYRMGYAAIPMFIVGGLFFFIPYILMMIEFGTGFKNQSGGIYSWMEKSVNMKFAFMGIMMWYSSYVIWMFGKSLSIWVPLSYFLLGKDITTTPVTFGGTIDFGPFLLGVVGILLVLLLVKLLSFGPNKFAKIAGYGGISVIALNVILLVGGVIVYFVNGFQLQEPMTMSAFTTSPNPDYTSIMPFLGFVVFSVFAFGGVEAMAGIADDLKNPERDLKRGIYIAGAFTVVCYVLGFLMVGAIMSWNEFPSEGVSSLNSLFIIMGNLGDQITGQDGSLLGAFLTRFSGLGMFLSYLGAMIALMYGPLKQLIGGTPKEFWPESFQERNGFDMPMSAVKVQAIIVCIFIGAKSVFSLISPDGAAKLYELVITMTNVGMTIPYLFLIFAWYKYRNDDSLEKGIVIFKSKGSILFASISTGFLVAFGNVFTILDPFIATGGESIDWNTGIWTIIGPIVFMILGLYIYNRSESKVEK